MGSAIDRYLRESAPKNPIDSLISAGPQETNPIDNLASVPPKSIVPEKPTLGSIAWDAIKEQGRELVQFGKYALFAPPVMGAPNAFAGPGLLRDIAQATEGDPEAQNRLDRGLRGGALAASTVVSGGASAALKLASGPVVPSLARRALTFATSEALGGATFGAVRPTEGDETRTEAIAKDAALFPIGGAVLHGAFKATGKVFQGTVGKLSENALKAFRELDAKQAKVVAEKAAKIAEDITPESASPEATEFAHTQALEQALEPISEKQFQDELAAITPKAAAPVDENAAALARVEAARTTPFPGADIPPRITDPLPESKVRDEAGGLKRVYHGTSAMFDEFNPDATSVGNLYGRGAYFTDNPTIAEGYTNKGLDTRVKHLTESIDGIQKLIDEKEASGSSIHDIDMLRKSKMEYEDDLGKLYAEHGITKSSNIRPAYLDIKNPFNIDEVYPVEQAAKIIKDAGVTLAIPVDKPLTGQEIYDIIDAMSPGDSRESFQAAGFDGITHVGGARTGNEPHQVYIAFNKDQIHTPWEVELQRVMAQAAENPGPAAEAAVADAVTTAVVEQTPITEMMTERAAQQTAEVSSSEATVAAAEEPTFLDLYQGDKLAAVADKALQDDNIDPIVEQLADQLQGGVEEIRPTWQQVVSDTQPEGSTAWNLLAKLTGDQLNSIENAVKRFGIEETGAITLRMANKLALGTAGGVLEMAAQDVDDPENKAKLRYAGGFLALAAVMPGAGMKKLLGETKWTRNIIKMAAMDKLMSGGSKEALETWQGFMTTGRTMAKLAELQLKKVFPDKTSQTAFMHVLDRGQTAPEWLLLSPEQQKEALSHHMLNLNMGKLLQSLGILDEYREDYVRHLLPPETFQAWRSQWETLKTAGNFTKARQFETLTEVEAWAKATGREGPVMDPSVVQPFHLIEAYRSIANNQTKDLLERVGLIKDLDVSVALPPGWRQIKVANLSKKMGPDDVATLMERAAAGMGKFGVFDTPFKALDSMKAIWMRTIMLFPWEHGINVSRAALAIDGTGLAASKALQAIKRADPALLEASRYGLDLFQRPDFGLKSAGAFQKALHAVGVASPALGKVGHFAEDMFSRGERLLWDKWVPSVGFAAYTKYMRDWGVRTGGKFLVGSSEYITAARAAAKFGNTAMGKVPELIQDPAAQFMMRQALFSPSWLRTRMSLTAHAAGDLTKIMSGELNPRDATYLKYKMRSVLLGIGTTYALSKVLSGKAPKFNPNSNKFYARTGIRDDKGREQGLDMVGWWQDDIKMLNDPFTFFRDRENPMLRVAGATINGRDQFGQEIVGMDRIENILNSFGPGSEAIHSAMIGKPVVKSSEERGYRLTATGLRDLSGVFAVGNVAALPKPMDAMISKIATKILRVNGLPQNDDRVWTLSRLLRQNFAMSGALYGGNLNTYIAHEKRSYDKNKTLGPLWNHARKALKRMARD